MGNYNFEEDLIVATQTEIDFGKFLENRYGAKIIEYNDTNKYDILAEVQGENLSFEIKEDFMCGNTGNIAVEFECRGKPSGIQVTEADFYIYKVHKGKGVIKYTFHRTDTLRKMIESKKYFKIVNGGDKGSNSMNYLFKYKAFIREGKEIDP